MSAEWSNYDKAKIEEALWLLDDALAGVDAEGMTLDEIRAAVSEEAVEIVTMSALATKWARDELVAPIHLSLMDKNGGHVADLKMQPDGSLITEPIKEWTTVVGSVFIAADGEPVFEVPVSTPPQPGDYFAIDPSCFRIT